MTQGGNRSAREAGAGWTYETAVAYLEHALKFGINPSLAGIRALCESLGRPQDQLEFVQVTGTNGKSSVTRMIARILEAHGVRTGTYTSPHLVSYAERFELGTERVSNQIFASAMGAVAFAAEAVTVSQLDTLGLADDLRTLGGPETTVSGEGESARASFTEFELLTAAALHMFTEQGVRLGCLEVGMGGRWDATSVVRPAVAVVTGVALDHTDRLGGTLAAIAEDKSHIIKPGSVAVLGPATADVGDILAARANEVGAPMIAVAGEDDDGLGLPDGAVQLVRYKVTHRPLGLTDVVRFSVAGARADYDDIVLHAPAWQANNAVVAIAAAEAALDSALDAGQLRDALANTRFPGRFEVLRQDPPLVLDGGHNPEAAGIVARALSEAFPKAKPVALIGILRDKDAAAVVRALAPAVSGFVCTQNSSPRCLAAEELASIVEQVTGERPPSEPDLMSALRLAEDLAGDGGVVVTGSLYTVGELRGLLISSG